jgi:hypothetical protein
MEIFKQYWDAEKLIHEYFGYVEQYQGYPIDDRTNMFWRVNEKDGIVKYSESMENWDDDQYYKDEIYKQIYLATSIYTKPDYTMILCKCDSGAYLRIFDNSKEFPF